VPTRRADGRASIRSSSSRPTDENTPIGLTALPTETVEVIDPTHPLYGLKLPLLGITVQQRLGRVCRVWLHPGIERAIPIAATDRGNLIVGPSRCRLSPGVIATLVALVASLPSAAGEDADADGSPGATCWGAKPRR
jgi:hypothetical protein